MNRKVAKVAKEDLNREVAKVAKEEGLDREVAKEVNGERDMKK